MKQRELGEGFELDVNSYKSAGRCSVFHPADPPLAKPLLFINVYCSWTGSKNTDEGFQNINPSWDVTLAARPCPRVGA